MRTNIIIDDDLKEKWWEIKKEADRLNMKIGDYIIFCHDLRKKMVNKDKILEILENPSRTVRARKSFTPRQVSLRPRIIDIRRLKMPEEK